MKKLLSFTILTILALGFIGCEDDNDEIWDPAPATPQGVYSVTGDEAVYVYFNGIYETDVDEYLVYRSFDAVNNYEVVGVVDAISNPSLDLLIYEYVDTDVENGETYYYAIAAVDFAGQTSDLSAENVFDTPRPDGQVTLFPNNILPSSSGFNLETHTVVYDTSLAADVFIDIFDGFYYINVTDVLIDIQDMGFTSDFDEIGYAADTGWSELGYSELIPGHTYLIWTADNHFAKMRLASINGSGSVTFQWAYQTDEGNLELALPLSDQKPQHDPDYPRDKKQMSLIK